jgi:1-acyl-sn-glycerol-3-phosphate acyltransferase
MIATAIAAASRLISGSVVDWQCDPRSDVQRIYFANHSSHLDFIVIWAALPPRLRRLARPVAGSDYWNCGAVRRYLAGRVFRAVLIDRTHPESANAQTSARASLQKMTDAMGERSSLIVFPEGTRSLNGDVGPFKSGLFYLSRARPDAELIPVYLENLNRILPKGETLPVPMLSRVIFGRCLGGSDGEDKAAFLARAREALLQLRTRG